MQRQVYAYAQGLLEGLGVKRGSKVAAWMGNEVEHVVLQYAAALVGAAVVEIDPKLGFDAVL
jgi:acyl-CoA synthetase (AMP-forming)/AMP-acid ligase II